MGEGEVCAPWPQRRTATGLELIVINADTISSCEFEPVELTASSGTIVSPGFDEQIYPNNALCQWLITAPSGKVSHVISNVASMEQME